MATFRFFVDCCYSILRLVSVVLSCFIIYTILFAINSFCLLGKQNAHRIILFRQPEIFLIMTTLPHNILPFVHFLLSQHLKTGDCVADCTAGNGNDTLFLAQSVGKKGQVWAFDIQEIALQNTFQRLSDAGFSESVQLILDGHQNIDQHIHKPLDAVMFNLGYLPQGDKSCTTNADNTIIALKKSLELLQRNGILSVVLYGGHETGFIERMAVEQFSNSIKQQSVDVLRYQFANRPKTAPYALIFRKITDDIIFQAT